MTPRIHVACDCDNHRRRTRTALALTVVALTLPLLAAALLGLVTLTDGDSKSIMVVRYACMAFQTGSGCSALFYDLPAGGVPLREQCSVQPVSPGHSHCGATQQAY